MKLTWRESYKAVYGFLDGIWREVAEGEQDLLSELDRFLGGMILREDETSTDPNLIDLWHEAVAQITGGSGWGDMTEAEAYGAMCRFLDLWARDNSDGTLLGICQDLARTGPEREGWAEAVQKVRNGEFDPYFGLIET